MAEQIFADTSAIYAYVNAKDPDHRAVKRFLNAFKNSLLNTNFIFFLFRYFEKMPNPISDFCRHPYQFSGKKRF